MSELGLRGGRDVQPPARARAAARNAALYIKVAAAAAGRGPQPRSPLVQVADITGNALQAIRQVPWSRAMQAWQAGRCRRWLDLGDAEARNTEFLSNVNGIGAGGGPGQVGIPCVYLHSPARFLVQKRPPEAFQGPYDGFFLIYQMVGGEVSTVGRVYVSTCLPTYVSTAP